MVEIMILLISAVEARMNIARKYGIQTEIAMCEAMLAKLKEYSVPMKVTEELVLEPCEPCVEPEVKKKKKRTKKK